MKFSYQQTKYQTEKLAYEYRKQTGNKFPVGDVSFEFSDDKKDQTTNKFTKFPKSSSNTQESIKITSKRPKGWYNVRLW